MDSRADDALHALIDELRGYVGDRRVLEAIAAVPRELFVAPGERRRAFDNTALPIGCGQTISQPLVVARMCEQLELRGSERVLEVGTGSGYHAAVLARLTSHVWSIERHPELSAFAAQNLAAAGVENVTLIVGDGSRGHPAEAPYDAISVAAAVEEAVLPALEGQLSPGGRLIAPVLAHEERLVLATKVDGATRRRILEPVRFVRLVSDQDA
jgi:protein-L-isoaspartate(D-aspartate) O-methyltransferase